MHTFKVLSAAVFVLLAICISLTLADNPYPPPSPPDPNFISNSPGSTSPPVGDGQRIPLPIDPHIASGSKCRGACGEDCPSTCKPKPDIEICVESKDGKYHENWKYTGVIECGSHQACRIHDECYDNCATDSSPMSCRRGCDVACTDQYDTASCAAWTVGKGNFDSYILFSNPPTSSDLLTTSLLAPVGAGPCPSVPGSSTLHKGPLLAGPISLPANRDTFQDVLFLDKDKPYILVGEGTCSLWDNPPTPDGVDSCFCYAKWRIGDTPQIWGQLELSDPSIHLSDLITQNTGNPAEYNSSHVYEAVIIGEGKPLKARVSDGGGYSDNYGELRISIYQAFPTT